MTKSCVGRLPIPPVNSQGLPCRPNSESCPPRQYLLAQPGNAREDADNLFLNPTVTTTLPLLNESGGPALGFGYPGNDIGTKTRVTSAQDLVLEKKDLIS